MGVEERSMKYGKGKASQQRPTKTFVTRSSPILDNGWTILLISRVVSGIFNIIHDCDEVYNYWEPLHYLVYGYGMQTWEYSAAFALRSWWYILIHALIGWPLSLVFGNGSSKVFVFYGIKVVLAVVSGLAEYSLCKALAARYHHHVAKLYLVFSAFSSGMFVSASAFLPSSVAMVAMTYCAAGVLNDSRSMVIWGAVLGCTWGWIVAGLSFVPYALWVLWSSPMMLIKSFGALFVALVSALGPLVVSDRLYYGSWKASLVNFLEYNVHGGGKSDLYGVEPATYYLRNGINQLQTVLPLALVFPLVALIVWACGDPRLPSASRVGKMAVVVSPAFVWLCAISALPHKEERFLYVVYPLCMVAAACVVFHVKEIIEKILPSWLVRKLVAIGVLGTCALSLSRSQALVHHYGSIMKIYRYLPELPVGKRAYVCVGTEWYRYPSSFFLPGTGYRLQFVASGFDGLLPRPFEEGIEGTKAAPPQFNDDNRSEPDNYWDTADACDFFVTSAESHRGPWIDDAVLKATPFTWNIRSSLPFVDASSSPALTRALYIPYLSQKKNVWLEYILLEKGKQY
jgi:alpha-1,2-mannosyltransferase